jgi:hypothetical protein
MLTEVTTLATIVVARCAAAPIRFARDRHPRERAAPGAAALDRSVQVH